MKENPIVSRSVEIDHGPVKSYTVVCKYKNGSETRRQFTERSFRKQLEDEAKRMELRVLTAPTQSQRDKYLRELDRHLFMAHLYGFAIRSRYGLPNTDIIQGLNVETR